MPPEACGMFAAYMAEVLRWRARINLTGFRGPRAIARHGFVESLAFLRALPPGPLRVVDIGSGAGFPGIPLRLARPDLRVTLIEARRRRHSFLAHVCRQLGLDDVECLLGRAEALGKAAMLRGAFDAAFARAVRRPEEAGALAAPLLRPAGVFLALLRSEALPPSIAGYGPAATVPVALETTGQRHLLVYPRAA